jgi:DNA-binding NarL/FixJ family response regulator
MGSAADYAVAVAAYLTHEPTGLTYGRQVPPREKGREEWLSNRASAFDAPLVVESDDPATATIRPAAVFAESVREALDQRDVAILRAYRAGHSYRELAAATGLSHQTVAVIVKRLTVSEARA